MADMANRSARISSGIGADVVQYPTPAILSSNHQRPTNGSSEATNVRSGESIRMERFVGRHTGTMSLSRSREGSRGWHDFPTAVFQDEVDAHVEQERLDWEEELE